MEKKITYIILLLLINLSGLSQPPLPPRPPEEKIKGELIYDFCEKQPEFPGSTDSLRLFLTNRLIYPIKSLDEKTSRMIVYYRFVVEKDGSITNFQLQKGLTDCVECNKEALAVLKLMPKWKPALNKVSSDEDQKMLEEVRSYSGLPVHFRVYNKPTLPRGYDSLSTFLKENLVYPKEALKNKIQGRVYLKLLFAKTGEIDQVVVLRGLENCPKCDAEAVRLMKSIPKTFMKANSSNSSPNPFFFNTYVEFKLE